MNKSRFAIVILILLATLALSYAVPKPKYTSPKMISKLHIPYRIYSWYGKDMSGNFNVNDMRYNFISEVFAHLYTKFDERLLFIVLDAGNFHNPKVCFGASGFESMDLPDTEFKAADRTFKAKTVFFHKKGEGEIIIYWLCIDKKITDWTGQKIKEFVYTLLNKQKTGLMVRIEIPCSRENIDSAVKTAKSFVLDLGDKLDEEQASYLFGVKK